MAIWTTHRDHGTATWPEVQIRDRVVISTRGAERTEIVGTVTSLTVDSVTIQPGIPVNKADFDIDRIYRQQ